MVMKRDASSDLDDEELSNLMIWARVRSGTLLDGMGKSSERKMWDLDQLWVLILLMKDASEFPTMTMVLAQYVMPLIGYVYM